MLFLSYGGGGGGAGLLKMVSDASKKKAAQKKAAAAAKRGGKAAAAAGAASSKAAAAAASSAGAETQNGADKLADGVGSMAISDRTCTGVLCSHPLSRDIRVSVLFRGLLGGWDEAVSIRGFFL